MPANDVVRARIDRRIKEEAAAILGAAGLTISDAFRMIADPDGGRQGTAVRSSSCRMQKPSRP